MAVHSSARKRKRSRKEKRSKWTDEELKSKRQRTNDNPQSDGASMVVGPAKEVELRSKDRSEDQSAKPADGRGSLPIKQFEEMKSRKRKEREERKRREEDGSSLQLVRKNVEETNPDQPTEFTKSSGGGKKWVISDPVGGRLLHIDPQFTNDEE